MNDADDEATTVFAITLLNQEGRVVEEFVAQQTFCLEPAAKLFELARRTALKGEKLLVGALIMGVVTFLAIVLFAIPPLLNPTPALPGEGAGRAAIAAPGDSSLPVITYLAVAVALMELVLSFVVPR
jgi:hypothetical protein